MADIVNLRQFRKQKARADKERVAEQNRVLHGRSKGEKARQHDEAQKAGKFVDGHRRAPSSDPDAP